MCGNITKEQFHHGCEVHHIDHDKDNNKIENLELMTKKEHAILHSNEKVKTRYDEIIKNLNENARPKASEWHKSEEGRQWHKQQYEKIKDKLRSAKRFNCKYCGKEYESFREGFCSNKCKSAWRRKQGLDNETRICKICDNEFITNKYSKAQTCSRSCANKLKS